ncbi:MAG: hypothetical protein ABEH90_09350 [Halolamina sp.]
MGERFGTDRLPAPLLPRVLATGLFVGLVSGMAEFVYVRDGLAPGFIEPWWALLAVAVAGGFVHVFTRDLAESVAAAAYGLLGGVAVHVGAYVSPLFVLADPPTGAEFLWYEPGIGDALLIKLAGRAMTTALFTYLLAFLCGWLIVVSLYGTVYD